MNRLIFVLLLITFVSKAQHKLLGILPLINGKVVYLKVLEVKNISKDSLHFRAKNWLISNGEKPEEILNNDINIREIRSKSYFKILWGPNDFKNFYITVSATFYIKTRNERYQYEISNFIIKETGLTAEIEVYKMKLNRNNKYNKMFYQELDQCINNYIISLEKSMQNGP